MDKKKILVVEDEQTLTKAIQEKLEQRDFEVHVSRNVDEAFAKLTTMKNVDAIWLDHYLLGRENGMDFVNRLKSEDGEWRHVPVFVVSNSSSNENIQTYTKRYEVTRYYVKAENRLDEIVQDIRDYLDAV